MSAPKANTRGVYRSPYEGNVGFEVVRVEGNLCYAKYDCDPVVAPFIWRHKEGRLNTLHDWKGKDDSNSLKVQGARDGA